MPEDQVRQYLLKRTYAKSQIQRLETSLNRINADTPMEELQIRIENLEKAFTDFKDFDIRIVLYPNNESELEDVEEKYMNIKTKLRAAINQKSRNSVDSLYGKLNDSLTHYSESHQQLMDQLNEGFIRNAPPVEIKLPALNIPKYDGKQYETFPCFRDAFEAAVHNRQSLSASQKFQYLHGLLTGEAFDLIRHMSITGNDYNNAWEMIKKRYDKKRHLVTNYVRRFIEQPTISNNNCKHLRQLANVADEIIRGLGAIGGEADTRDPWLVFMLVQKLDAESRQAWATHSCDWEFPTYTQLLSFINNRCDAFETCEVMSKKSSSNRHLKSNAASSSTLKCHECSGNHSMSSCIKYIQLPAAERKTLVESKGLCYNCLNKNHLVTNCKLRYGCKICNRRHHTTLHDACPATTNDKLPDTTSTNTCLSTDSNFGAILPTISAMMICDEKQVGLCRILLDSGSSGTLVSEACVQRLGLKRQKLDVLVTGVGGSSLSAKGQSQITLQSLTDPSVNITVNAVILRKLTRVSAKQIDKHNMDILRSLKLADRHFEKPGSIDIILGMDVFFEILRDGTVRNEQGLAIAHNTVFGYIVGGNVNTPSDEINFKLHSCSEQALNLESILQRFWEQEEVDKLVKLSNEEQQCEDLFNRTTTRQPDGRYIVHLPLKDVQIGNSYSLAMKRLLSVERRLHANEQLKTQYIKVMDEYLKLNHMVEASDGCLSQPKFYLPHHCVIREESTTTKLRVVFDGSVKSFGGCSLNDALMNGPTVQPTLWSILIKFRGYPIALCGDIEKMYRQILITEDHQNFQRILWRNHTTEPIKEYKLRTVTYGTKSAPFLATRTLNKVAEDNINTYPDEAKVILSNFYVDDLIAGADDEISALRLKTNLSAILTSGGFNLRKWKSSVPKLNEENNELILSEESDTVKVLGVVWNPMKDIFSFTFSPKNIVTTKRQLLSESSTIFDPLGWLSASTIQIKILYQKLWLLKLDWDDRMPDEFGLKWQGFRDQLKFFAKLEIPRFIGCLSEWKLEGFCDASESAYAAVIYVKSTSQTGQTKIQLLTAKSRVTPLRQISLPRLELNAALLLTRLFESIRTTLAQPTMQIRAWTDSTAVLGWLSDEPRNFQTYIANRTSEILTSLPRTQWNHVKSKENPADLASRGVSPKMLIQSELWWQGPHWLHDQNCSAQESFTTDEERKKNAITTLTVTPDTNIFASLTQTMSSWRKIRRVAAYCFRFVKNCQKCKPLRTIGPLLASELQTAEKAAIQWSQDVDFNNEKHKLQQKKNINQGRLSTLHPFIDDHGILRVGGRLENLVCPYEAKHPAILSASHIMSKLLVRHIHHQYYHPGPSLLTQLCRQKFWILGGRSLCRQTIKNCLVCCKTKTETQTQLMGNLPSCRLSTIRAFNSVGIDYAGPIMLVNRAGRGAKLIKGYIAIFVCMATKALHIEVVSDLTTEAFMAALKRFSGRRGSPAHIYSDNGTYFVGAKRKLDEYQKLIYSKLFNDLIKEFTAEQGIQWHFMPPSAPHFGGLYEAAVKSVKHHLIRATKNTHLTFEEMSTLLVQIEAVLNSRPLCPLSNDDVDNYDALTPGHFLIFGPLTTPPESSIEGIPEGRLNRWQLITQRVAILWKRFSNEYINTLQQRTKWKKNTDNIKINDVVIIKEDNLPPGKWLMGRIIETHPGSDSLVRAVTVKTKNSIIKRPITKVALLPIN